MIKVKDSYFMWNTYQTWYPCIWW